MDWRTRMSVPRELLRRMFDAAIASAQPSRCIPAHLPAPQEFSKEAA